MTTNQNEARNNATASGGTDDAVFSAKRLCRVGVWNVRTLAEVGRKELLADELVKSGISLAVLSEARLKDSGESLINCSNGDKAFNLYHSGGATHTYGVAFAIDSRFDACVRSFTPVCDRIAVLELDGIIHTTVIGVYAPTEVADARVKDTFYQSLQSVLDAVPSTHAIMVAGVLNAEAGSDPTPFRRTIGKFGIGAINDNSLRMLSFASANGFVVADSFFRKHHRLRYSFYSNDRKTKKQSISVNGGGCAD